jgi:GNAT superfamily N-acetyltransferase
MNVFKFKPKQSDGTILNLKVYGYDFFRREFEIIGGSFIAVIEGEEPRVKNFVTMFRLEPFNGCSGICISRNVEIREEYKGKGLGIQFLNLRESIAKDFGYSAMMCSVVLGNHQQQKIMKRGGWEHIAEFDNKRTNNRVRVYYKKL